MAPVLEKSLQEKSTNWTMLHASPRAENGSILTQMQSLYSQAGEAVTSTEATRPKVRGSFQLALHISETCFFSRDGG